MQELCTKFCILAFVILCLAGCDDGLSQIGGVVTVDGQIITKGEVVFHPADGGRSGSGRIKPDGTYIISCRKIGDGMPPGEYKVTVVSKTFISAGGKAPTDDELAMGYVRGKTKHDVPEIYNQKATTPLTCTITEDGDYDQYNLELTTDVAKGK